MGPIIPNATGSFERYKLHKTSKQDQTKEKAIQKHSC
jgi:hypothetical protein